MLHPQNLSLRKTYSRRVHLHSLRPYTHQTQISKYGSSLIRRKRGGSRRWTFLNASTRRRISPSAEKALSPRLFLLCVSSSSNPTALENPIEPNPELLFLATSTTVTNPSHNATLPLSSIPVSASCVPKQRAISASSKRVTIKTPLAKLYYQSMK